MGKDGKRHKFTVTRTQVPLQLAFAITAHGAQGRTVPSIVADLHIKGSAKYVAASRAKTREGLAITRPISSLSELNVRPSRDLRVEMERISALAHNTMARHCPEKGLLPVPVPEHAAELLDSVKKLELKHPTFEILAGDTSKRGTKRKAAEIEQTGGTESLEDSRDTKRQHKVRTQLSMSRAYITSDALAFT